MLRYYGEVPRHLVIEALESPRWSRNDRIGEDIVPVSRVSESIAFVEEEGLPLYQLPYRAMLYGGACLEQFFELAPYDDRYWLRRGRSPGPMAGTTLLRLSRTGGSLEACEPYMAA